ncbi:MAG: hypothetical protein LBU39_04145 [Desulfobulbaceae bacterium]|jgi:hypothetical protein|nr:hypothetical protein [Desulfobulbaceae bacterium]
MPEYQIDLISDHKAAVWIATSQAIAENWFLESGFLGALIERARFAAPE